MTDPTRPAQTDETLVRLARNGAEPLPRYVRWVCDGVLPSGRSCGRILMETEHFTGHIRIDCPKCGKRHERMGGS